VYEVAETSGWERLSTRRRVAAQAGLGGAEIKPSMHLYDNCGPGEGHGLELLPLSALPFDVPRTALNVHWCALGPRVVSCP